ncbi:MAG: hypothetical protein IPM29_03350 [Planctomycetes bacterium]|nr:hypothetical protein [Planctomycetota bacterium]
MTDPHRCLRMLVVVAAILSPAGSATGQEADPLITLNVQDEDLGNLLRALAVQHRLNLVTGDQVKGRVSINLYDVPLREAMRQILATQGLGFVHEDGFYRVMTLAEQQAALQEMDAIETRVLSLNHLTGTEARQLLQPLLSGDGQLTFVAPGSQQAGTATSSGAIDDAGSSGQRQAIVVRDHGSRVTAIARTLAELDRPPQQVLLEATILSIDLGEDNRLGIDFNVLGGIDFNQAGVVTDLTRLGSYSVGGGVLDDLLISGRTFGFTNGPTGKGLSIGFIQNNVAAFVEALEETTNATIVSNPRVIALNGQQAEIIVGGRLGYRTLVQNQTSTIEEVHFLDTGTQLVFRPFVGDDGWIRMEVHPQNSTGVVDPASGIPSESTTEITTRILMRDGQTLILGGLINESVSTVRSQIPLLGSLPLVGWLFGRTQETVGRRELVILLTPHILDPVDASARAEEVRRRFEAVRGSHWDSLSPYIRPVLARGSRADAEVLRARGEPLRALGAVERALALDPTDADSAVLRSDLLEELALRSLPVDEATSALSILQNWNSDGMRTPPPIGGR